MSKNADNFLSLNDFFEAAQEPYRKPRKWLAPFGFIAATVAGGLIVAALFAPFAIPSLVTPRVANSYWDSLPKDLPELPLPQRSVMLDANGNKIADFYSQNRIVVKLQDVSQHVIDALIATEDSRFYEHVGIDWQGVGRAAINDITGKHLQGASTITQQLVKNTLLAQASNQEEALSATEQSFSRKIDEMSYARELEKKYTKDEILEKYLNIVLYSNGIYGIETAAEYYFNKKAIDLTVSESALLIGLLKNPSAYDPIDHPEAATARRAVVLDRMVTTNKITEQEAAVAKQEPLNVQTNRAPNGCGSSTYPFFCQWVMDSIVDNKDFGNTPEDRQALIYRGGLTITTTLDPRVQDIAQQEVDTALGRDNRVAGGIAIIEPGTGRVKALAENRSWGKEEESTPTELRTEINYPTREAFQVGSTFKVFTLATALEAGMPADAKLQAPSVYNPSYMNVPKGGITNLARNESGLMSLYEATAKSSNTFYALLQEKVGVLNVADMARNLGLTVPNTVTSKDASFTLGVIDTSPLKMAAAYATFAANGLYCEPIGVMSYTTVDAPEAIHEASNTCRQAVSRNTAAAVNDILSQVIDGPVQSRTGKTANIGRQAAGKTGTTSSHSSAWFAGYTPQYATAVWLGDPRGGFKYPLSTGVRFYGKMTKDVYGAQISAPLWQHIMSRIHEGLPQLPLTTSPLGLSSDTTIPDVRGIKLDVAQQTLTDQGFQVTINPEKIVSPDSQIPSGVVLDQQPAAGTKVVNPTETMIVLSIN